MGGKGSPAPPDYTGAAQATGTSNLEVARATAAANRVNQVTPYGNLTYAQNGMDQFGNPNYTATTALSPDQQALQSADTRTSLGLSGLENQGLGYVQGQLNTPFNQGALPSQTVNAGQTGQQAIMGRLQPNIDAQRAQLATQLQNQGITQGSEAWTNAQRDQNQRENDLLLGAATQGIGIGNTARSQAIQEQSFFRNEPINTLNAVRSGAQVTQPQFQNVAPQQNVGGVDYAGAAANQYGAALGASNARNAQTSQNYQTVGTVATLAMMY